MEVLNYAKTDITDTEMKEVGMGMDHIRRFRRALEQQGCRQDFDLDLFLGLLGI